eukprot:421994-Rhodomonas_salina.1
MCARAHVRTCACVHKRVHVWHDTRTGQGRRRGRSRRQGSSRRQAPRTAPLCHRSHPTSGPLMTGRVRSWTGGESV